MHKKTIVQLTPKNDDYLIVEVSTQISLLL